jgi:two-component system sensor histidine kinase TctE
MFWKRKRSPIGLRGQVLAVLLPGLVAIIAIELWLTRMDAIDAANGAFDRSLMGAIRAVDLNVSTASGGLAVELPYRLFEFFQLTARGNVYFRVATTDGLVEIGNPDLPQPDEQLEIGMPVFRDGHYFGEQVRVGTYVRSLERPLGAGSDQRLMIQVAETVESRRAFTWSFVLRSAVRDAVVLSTIGIALTAWLTYLLRPVERLATELRARRPNDLTPINALGLTPDIQPLVDAVNQQLERTQALMTRQRHFVDDASHQLRTPLATLHAQVGYALRHRSMDELVSALRSIAEELDRCTRSTNQLLALARSDSIPAEPECFDLGELIREVATRLLPLVRARQLDFGIDELPEPCLCAGTPALLAEAIANLVHNAIAYTPFGGRVALSVECDTTRWRVTVIDAAPAVSEGVKVRVGERFVKGELSRGAGLGLAIVKSIMEHHQGALEIERMPDDTGNRIGIRWPVQAPTDPTAGRP